VGLSSKSSSYGPRVAPVHSRINGAVEAIEAIAQHAYSDEILIRQVSPVMFAKVGQLTKEL
jgi:hypothetical protein